MHIWFAAIATIHSMTGRTAFLSSELSGTLWWKYDQMPPHGPSVSKNTPREYCLASSALSTLSTSWWRALSLYPRDMRVFVGVVENPLTSLLHKYLSTNFSNLFKRKEVRLIGSKCFTIIVVQSTWFRYEETLAMCQLNGTYPVASDALYNLQIGVTAYCIPCFTRTGRIPSSPGDLYGAIDSNLALFVFVLLEPVTYNRPNTIIHTTEPWARVSFFVDGANTAVWCDQWPLCHTSHSVQRRGKNIDSSLEVESLASSWKKLRRVDVKAYVVVEKDEESRRTFNKNSCDLLTAITHRKFWLSVAYFW